MSLLSIDDPYYCGLRARIPAFVQKAFPGRNKSEKMDRLKESRNGHMAPSNGQHVMSNGNGHGPMAPMGMNGNPHASRYPGPPHIPMNGHPMMWHAKSVDSGMGKEKC